MTDKELKRTVAGFRRGLLGTRESLQMCWAVCWPLQSFLGVLDVDCELTKGTVEFGGQNIGHFWLTLTDGRIIDPTADQFTMPKRRMPRVYMGPLPSWYRVVKERKSKRG